MKAAQEARAQKTLNTLMRYEEGVMSRKDWIKLKHRDGNFKVRKEERKKYLFCRRKYNRMNHAEQEVYEKKLEQTKIQCELYHITENSFYDITEAEYNFFNSLSN